MASLAHGELGALRAMLGRCSRETLFHRFHGFTDGRTHVEALTGPGSDTMVAWSDDDRCAGFATMAEADGRAEIGVLVEDGWQRHGVGRLLLVTLLRRARHRGLRLVHLDVLGDDAHLVRALSRCGPLTVRLERGVYSVEMSIVGSSRPDVSLGEEG